MSGEQLVRQLQLLGAPGAEQLVGETYDWLFMNAAESPLAAFLQWFMDNITTNNVLTKEEINEFEALEAKGEVMTAAQLQEIEGAITPVVSNTGVTGQGAGELLPSPEELDCLEEELKVLTLRKNMINAHKIELCDETYKLGERLRRAQSELQRETEAVSSTNYHFTKAQQSLAHMLDTQLNALHMFGDTGVEEKVFLSQVDLEEWHREEEKFTHLLQDYTHKQFKEGVSVVSVSEDCSQSVLVETEELDVTLVCGVSEEQYNKNMAELTRLSALLPQTEAWRVEGLMMQERRKAEVQEAERLLASLQQGHMPKELTVLRQQTQEAQDSLTVVEKESCRQQHALKAVVAAGVETDSLRVIAADHDLKLQHLEYLLSKQNIVLEQVVSQAARYNWVIIALQTEGQKATNMLHVLRMINATMTDRHDSFNDRMVLLEALQRTSEEEQAAGVLPRPLQTLACLLPAPTQGKVKQAGSREVVVKQVEDLLAGLTVAQEQVTTFTSPQFSCLAQMMNLCEVLECSLFGSAGSLQALPLAWLEAALARRCTEAEHKVWEFKQKLIIIIAQYEKKKKILQVDPTVKKELTKWVPDIVAKFSR